MSRWRALLWPTVAAMVALAILLSLGTWQLQRRGEKEATLTALTRGIDATPLAVAAADLRRLRVLPPGRPATAGALGELTRIRIEGSFLDIPGLPVRATLPSNTRGAVTGGIGFFWMSPLRLDDGSILFVNRGFVPTGADFRPPTIPTPQGRQTIVGLLRAPEQRQMFTPADIPAKREFFIRDPETMARALDLDPALVAPLFVDAERAFLNTGAEGVYCAALPELGFGIALKCDDGATRAAESMMATLLLRFLALSETEHAVVAPLSRQRLTNWNGIHVGDVRPAGDLESRVRNP